MSDTTSAAPANNTAPASPAIEATTLATSTPATDTAAVEAAAQAKADPIAERLAKLVEREQKLRKERDETKKERAAAEERLAKYRDAERLLREDPVAALEKLGANWNEIAERLVKRTKADPAKDALSEVQKLKAELEAKELATKQAEIAQRLDTFKAQCVDFVRKDPDKYELINAHGLGEEVYNLIRSHWESNEEVLSPTEAADILEEQLTQRAQLFLAAKKFQKKSEEAPASPPADPATPARNVANKANSDGPRTLTNHVSAQRSDSAPHTGDEEKERIKRAIAALNRA